MSGGAAAAGAAPQAAPAAPQTPVNAANPLAALGTMLGLPQLATMTASNGPGGTLNVGAPTQYFTPPAMAAIAQAAAVQPVNSDPYYQSITAQNPLDKSLGGLPM